MSRIPASPLLSPFGSFAFFFNFIFIFLFDFIFFILSLKRSREPIAFLSGAPWFESRLTQTLCDLFCLLFCFLEVTER